MFSWMQKNDDTPDLSLMSIQDLKKKLGKPVKIEAPKGPWRFVNL